MAKQYNLLVVDDNQEILATIDKYFRKRNYNVVTAVDGLEALKLLKSKEFIFDLVVTDLVMPYISGVGVITIIKKEYPQIPVVAITGYGESPEALALEANADLVIEKPFDLDNLERSVGELLTKNL